jgi:hypothetical protein
LRWLGVIGFACLIWTASALAATKNARIHQVQSISAPAQLTPVQATLGCDGEAVPLSGGIVQTGPVDAGIDLAATGPLDETQTTLETSDGDTPAYWFVAVRNTQEARDYKALTICAKANARIEATQFKLDYGGQKRVKATCPGKRRAVGGGVVESGSPSEVFVGESGPTDAGGSFASTRDGDVPRGWSAIAYQLQDLNAKVTFRVFAVCAKHTRARIESATEHVPRFMGTDMSGHEDQVALCPGDKRVLGGGFLHDAASFEPVFGETSGPLNATGTIATTDPGDIAKYWYAALTNSAEHGVTLKALAICE